MTATVLAKVAGLRPFFDSGGRDGKLAPPAIKKASDAGGFANREESYAGTAQPPAPEGPTLVYDTASEAAAATKVEVPTILATDDPVLHLLRRTTWGPTPDLVAEVHGMGIDAWLAHQLEPMSIPDEESDAIFNKIPGANATPAEIRAGGREGNGWNKMVAFGQATLARQIWSRRQLYEVVVDFWANHLNVAVPSGTGVWDVGAAYHQEVIRQHAFGSFSDMLLTAVRHPAMLRYLTNVDNTKESPNENLGRELLELHTVGVGSGYTEDDVRNSAYILTGRSVHPDDHETEPSAFVYKPDQHRTGAVQVLDFTHANESAEDGLAMGDGYLQHLARHASTAQSIAYKLALRFVSDTPPETLVERMATTYTESDTQILPVLDVMFRSAEFWASAGQKTRRPLENLVATTRVTGLKPGMDLARGMEDLYWAAGDMGQQPIAWSAPNGYPDVQPAWRSVSAVVRGWNHHRKLIAGWKEGWFVTTPPAELVADMPQATVGEYVDSLCQRLCHQTFKPEHRDALFAFIEADPAAPVNAAEMPALVEQVPVLVLNSPYGALR